MTVNGIKTDLESKYFLQSDKGYRISKQFYKQTPIYTAWSPIPREIIRSGLKTKDDAIGVCELHYLEGL